MNSLALNLLTLALEALIQYSYEQGLAKRKLKMEELFLPDSLEFLENA